MPPCTHSLREWNFRDDSGNYPDSPPKNITRWNSTNTPPGLDTGYEILGIVARPENFSPNLTIVPLGGSFRYVICCANETNGTPGEAAIGYWSDNSTFDPLIPSTNSTSVRRRKNSMVTKWIVGEPLDALYYARYTPYEDVDRPYWIWPEPPKILALNCDPIIEQADVSVLVDLETGMCKFGYFVVDVSGRLCCTKKLQRHQSRSRVCYLR